MDALRALNLPADETAMINVLIMIGFNAQAITILRNQGVRTAVSFHMIAYNTLDKFKENLIKAAAAYRTSNVPPVLVRGPAGAAEHAIAMAEYQENLFVFPYLALQGLTALRAWMDFRYVRGETLDVTVFTRDTMMIWLDRINFIEGIKADKAATVIPPPPKLKDFTGWTIWEETFRTYIGQFRSATCSVPLTYLLRPDTAPSAETLAAPIDDIDEALIDTFSLGLLVVRGDNKKLYEIIKSLVLDETGGGVWHFISSFNSRQDGRQAFITLKAQAEGPAAIQRRKTLSYDILKKTFDGLQRNYTLDSYIAEYQKAFNELEALNEPVPETQKVRVFLTNMKCADFKVEGQIVAAQTECLEDFETCQQRLRALVLGKTPRTKRNLSSMATSQRYNKGKKDDRNSKRNKNTRSNSPKQHGSKSSNKNQGIGHYDEQSFNRLSKAKQEEIKAARIKAKAEKAAKLSADTQAGRTVSAIGTKVTNNLNIVNTFPATSSERPRAPWMVAYKASLLKASQEPEKEVTVKPVPVPVVKPVPVVDDPTIKYVATGEEKMMAFLRSIKPVMMKPATNIAEYKFAVIINSGNERVDRELRKEAVVQYQNALQAWNLAIGDFHRKVMTFCQGTSLGGIPPYPPYPEHFQSFANRVKKSFKEKFPETVFEDEDPGPYLKPAMPTPVVPPKESTLKPAPVPVAKPEASSLKQAPFSQSVAVVKSVPKPDLNETIPKKQKVDEQTERVNMMQDILNMVPVPWARQRLNEERQRLSQQRKRQPKSKRVLNTPSSDSEDSESEDSDGELIEINKDGEVIDNDKSPHHPK
jgi:hypothetical protein